MPTVQLVVEDGSGKIDSNSLATAVEFATYMWRIPSSYQAAFIAADPYLREQALIWATHLLEVTIIWPYGSYRKYQTQALAFPRLNLVDQDGFLVGESSVPSLVKDATCQLAFELLKSDLSVEPARGLSGITVGPISLSFDVTHPSNSTVRVIPRIVWTMLSPYGAVLRGSPRMHSAPLYRG